MNFDLRSLLICKICNNFYDNPVFLPCHCTTCKSHIPDLMNNSENSIKCLICRKKKTLPAEGFEENTQFKLLIENETHLTEKEKIIKRNFLTASYNIQTLISDYTDREANFEIFYKTHLKEIVVNIEARRDELIQKIKDISQSLVSKKITQIEKHFSVRLENNKLNLILEKIQNDEKNFQARFSRDLIDLSDLETLKTEQANILSQIQKKIDKFEHLKSKLIKFKFIKPCEYTFKNEFFGYLTYDFDNCEKTTSSSAVSSQSNDKLILVDSKQWRSQEKCCTCNTTFLGLSE